MNIHDLIPSMDWLEPGTCDDWSINRFEITEEGAKFENMMTRHMNRQGRPTMRGLVTPGLHTRLQCTGRLMGPETIMSDTLSEKLEHQNVVLIATGRVLINGLGMGMALNAILLRPGVTEVHVVERSPAVIKLVWPQFRQRLADGVYGDKQLILHDTNAYFYDIPKGMRYNVVWHDIWNDISVENLEGIKTLKRKYARRLVLPGKWQGAWMEGTLRAAARLQR
jgi:hypothetical protein